MPEKPAASAGMAGNVVTCADSKPRRDCSRFQSVWKSRPVPTSSSVESATSPATSAAAQLSAHGARADAARSRLQRRLRIGARHQQRGQQRREHGGDDGDGGEHQRPWSSEWRWSRRGEWFRRAACARPIMASCAMPTPTAQPHRLSAMPSDEHLPDEPDAAGAQRGAHGELLLAAEAAGDQKVGDIGAGNQQHQRQRAEAAHREPGAPGR